MISSRAKKEKKSAQLTLGCKLGLHLSWYFYDELAVFAAISALTLGQ
jgi:hypothetical protein